MPRTRAKRTPKSERTTKPQGDPAATLLHELGELIEIVCNRAHAPDGAVVLLGVWALPRTIDQKALDDPQYLGDAIVRTRKAQVLFGQTPTLPAILDEIESAFVAKDWWRAYRQVDGAVRILRKVASAATKDAFPYPAVEVWKDQRIVAAIPPADGAIQRFSDFVFDALYLLFQVHLAAWKPSNAVRWACCELVWNAGPQVFEIAAKQEAKALGLDLSVIDDLFDAFRNASSPKVTSLAEYVSLRERADLLRGKLLTDVAALSTADLPRVRHQDSPGSPTPPEGEWLIETSLADIANRLGNIDPRSAKKMLMVYGLKRGGNRQRWTVRLDGMPKNFRDKLTEGRQQN